MADGKFRKAYRKWRALFDGGEGGATAVEFAIIAPIFLAFLYGLLELARVIFTQGVLIYAVQEGSRYAAARGASTVAQIENVVTGKFIGVSQEPATLTVTPTVNPDGTRTVTVSVQYTFTWLVSLFGMSSITLQANSSSLSG
jgi:Flp pilus assembly protein TadG